jgi:hypothetical protein
MPVNVISDVIRTGTGPMASVPYSFREAANLMYARR